MKKFIYPLRFFFVLICGSSLLYACLSSPPPAVPASAAPQSAEKPQITGAGASTGIQNYFTGDGGKGITLAVLEPTGTGLSSSEEWILSLIQGPLTSDFNKYSAITVIDRLNLEKIIAEQIQSASGYYSEEDYISIGQLVNARFILAGNVIKTPKSLLLDLSITEVESGIRKASHGPKTISPQEPEILAAVKEAALDLLGQMGVKLTDAGMTALRGVGEREIEAEVALAKGITAQKSGTIIEALNYYYEASAFNPGLGEAAVRGSNLTTDISSGNIGENIRNEIEQRNAWKKLVDEAKAFYDAHPVYNVVYNAKPEVGAVNFDKGTANIVFGLWLEPGAGFLALSNFYKSVKKTGKTNTWGLGENELLSYFEASFGGPGPRMFVSAELLDAAGNVIGSGEKEFSIPSPMTTAYERYGQGGLNLFTEPTMAPVNLNGPWQQTGTQTYAAVARITGDSLSFPNVKADAITDVMSLRISSVRRMARRINTEMLQYTKITAQDKSFKDYFDGSAEYIIGKWK